MPKRKSTPKDTETEVLIMSARRCCICFGLSGDFGEKSGQIAHLDKDPSNSSFDNLAWLCLPHHDKYDSTTSQSKGLLIGEVKRYRTLLYEKVEDELRKSSQRLTNEAQSEPEVNETEVSGLLAKVQSRSHPLSQCIAEALVLARKANDTAFEDFCRNELSGYTGEDVTIPSYRSIDVFISPLGSINMQYLGWGGNTSRIFEFMRQHPDTFFPYKIRLAYSVSYFESTQVNLASNANAGVLHFPLKMGDIVPNAEKPDRATPTYGNPDSIRLMLDSIRRELTNHLLTLLPKAGQKRRR